MAKSAPHTIGGMWTVGWTVARPVEKTHRLSAEEIARRDEQWAATDDYTETFEDTGDCPPEQD